MKRLFAFFGIVIFLFSCSDSENGSDVCNSDNPLEMEWMAEIVNKMQNCLCQVSVFQGEYSGDVVFWQLMNDPLCQSVIDNVEVFNCRGVVIEVLNNYNDWVEFNQKLSGIKIIYSCLPKN